MIACLDGGIVCGPLAILIGLMGSMCWWRRSVMSDDRHIES